MNQTVLNLLDNEISRVSSKLEEYISERDSIEKEFKHYTQMVEEYEGKLHDLQQARDIIAAS